MGPHFKVMLGLCLLAAVPGCFYSLHTALPGHIKTISVPVFQNETLQAAIENELTQAVIEKFQVSNQISMADAAAADALLEGTLSGYENKVYRFNDREQAEEYVVTISLDVTVTDRVKGKDLWSEEGIRASSTYLLGGPQARTEADARREVFEQLATILVSKTVDGW